MTDSVRLQIEKAYNTKVLGAAEKATRALAVRVLAGVGNLTPVLSGHARNNWNIEVGGIDASTKPKPKDGDVVAAPDFDSIGQEKTKDYKLGQTIYVSNNLPYIKRLNDGYSKKAPENFIEISVKLAEENTESALKRGDYSK